jgi:hypothetical protein
VTTCPVFWISAPGSLSADSAERAFLELMTSGIRELARRLEQTEAGLVAYLPTP